MWLFSRTKCLTIRMRPPLRISFNFFLKSFCGGLFTSSLFVRSMSWMVPIRPPFIIIFVLFSFLHCDVCDCCDVRYLIAPCR